MTNPYEWFDKRAKDWNQTPGKIELCTRFVAEVRKQANITPESRILDFGCGTGLNGIYLINDAKTIGFLDPSSGMIEQVKKELAEINKTNVEIYNQEISQTTMEPFDFVVSSMAFHHAEDLKGTISAIAEKMKVGGKCFICDLHKEDGSFHAGFCTVPHNGFDIEELKQTFLQNGFSKAEHIDFGTYLQKEREYPLFVLTATK
ncbi:S-adenosylmethionine-dependent methyltransferase, putative [Trichomonas vaginalis G3]|uniref:S-adenosylmethionine-dependent methyltransferase, putative n=1 Tax=Trichomonas vaginalis (strain ATCC PRA-98 / G3) TaxID=412133 RepID=A2FEZ1_TRIV3|nr:hexaprenyldihydroxybenzoate methyltransferase protein [Trichomonas vaginalis G3]EAX96545.1 S-adenosylmethionine-dependent methyltransferase, putative [Trichomonas vaginalis G3]KAI5541087.1 hexaprenyldihydroxybenzoate methyltransferase protein [Trichomonas vaginalis G3]|eukprot:XP_001309475.1 S-adenosylmethionine-dependent methyltransferase [Trichomonas vaginalis G3]